MVDISDRRRELLYSVASIAGVGLTKFIWDQRDQGELLRVTQQSGPNQSGATSTFRIAEGEFTVWELAFERPNRLQYSFEVIDGPPIDVVLSDKSGQSKDDDGDWNYYPTASYLNGEDATVVDVLPPADYRLIFDNSNRLEASPPTNLREDPAIVTFQLDLSPIESSATDSANETTATATANNTTTASPDTSTTTASRGNETTTTASGSSDGNQ